MSLLQHVGLLLLQLSIHTDFEYLFCDKHYSFVRLKCKTLCGCRINIGKCTGLQSLLNIELDYDNNGRVSIFLLYSLL